jgi:hypothetical protein
MLHHANSTGQIQISTPVVWTHVLGFYALVYGHINAYHQLGFASSRLDFLRVGAFFYVHWLGCGEFSSDGHGEASHG